MPSQTYFVNCPVDTTIIEVVSPFPNYNIHAVTPSIEPLGTGLMETAKVVKIKCPTCNNIIYVKWVAITWK